MTDNTEIAAAAASGAAAAVETVQDQQHIEETAEVAATEAMLAADVAETSVSIAADANENAEVAVSAAVGADQKAEVAGQMADAALSDTEQLRSELAQVRSDQTAFFQEARGFFARQAAEQEQTDNGVTEVTVVDHSREQNENSGGGNSGGANAGAAERPKRHRFGH